MSHTPGPWKENENCVINYDLKKGICILEPEPGERFWTPLDDGVSPVSHDREIAANARLIAAAPELLQACEESLRLLTVRLEFAEIADDEKLLWNGLGTIISKAKGGA